MAAATEQKVMMEKGKICRRFSFVIAAKISFCGSAAKMQHDLYSSHQCYRNFVP